MDYHKDRFQDFSLMFYEGDELLAVLPANHKDGIIYSHQGLTYGSLVYRANVKFNKIYQIFCDLLKFLEEEGFSELVIKPIPHIYCSQPNDALTLILHKAEASIKRMDGLSVIDLRNPFRIARDRKQGIKRGMVNGLVIKEEKEFSSFWNDILIPNLQNKHNVFPVHALQEIDNLKTEFPKNIRQFNVYQQDNIVAGATVFETKYVAHMQYISGNEFKNELGSIDFLHHHLINEVFNHKDFFDFGHSSIDSGSSINESLLYWKEGFGARMVQHSTYMVETKNYRFLENYLG
ncbi:GNAT family N-acetyltransferase [Aegicerativicinus sediminis]|uniref:GNAT family N-acetyltransferase n=1 Tax=Aegicerativicinus sediminis TaxID=2893202 RepID=UPI001E624055|nr:GNAT family N-acetyltransferase [Aegicerativicinus sediminis]